MGHGSPMDDRSSVLRPKIHLMCPCGEYLEADTEDELVQATNDHLTDMHPTLTYTRDEILMLAF